MSKTIDALYEAAQKALRGPWRVDNETSCIRDETGYVVVEYAAASPDDEIRYIAAADPQTVMALVECYRAAIPTAHAMHYIALDEKPAIAIGRNHSEGCDLCAAIEKVEALDSGGGQGRG